MSNNKENNLKIYTCCRGIKSISVTPTPVVSTTFTGICVEMFGQCNTGTLDGTIYTPGTDIVLDSGIYLYSDSDCSIPIPETSVGYWRYDTVSGVTFQISTDGLVINALSCL